MTAPVQSRPILSSAEITVALPHLSLLGTLAVPSQARGLVLFAHGSGSSRFSPRNRHVAARLQEQGLGTLLFDLLTPEEDAADQRTGLLRFDIPLLADRLLAAAAWARRQESLHALAQGFFGASTGAAAALVAAAELGRGVFAVVSRGGRPDLADHALAYVQAPTLLLVGAKDRQTLGLNQWALERLSCEKRLDIIPGASHLFEEPGTLGLVADLASDWCLRHLAQVRDH